MGITRGLQIAVYDLGCGGAGAQTIERKLAATDGVLRVHENPAVERVYVDYDPDRTDPWTIVRAIEDAGYRAGRSVPA